MGHSRLIMTGILCALLAAGAIGCQKPFVSSFAAQSVKPTDLAKVKHKILRAGAVGESTGFKLLWIPFASPTEAEAKADMLARLTKEGISLAGKNIAFSNATADKGGFGFIGLIGAPSITLTADVVELLGQEAPQTGPPQN